MLKKLIPAALFCSLALGASAQAKKTTVQTKTTTATAPKPTVTHQTSPEPAPVPQQTVQPAQTEEIRVSATNASGGNETGEIKAAGGDVTLEANVNLLGGTVNLSNSLQQVRARYFLSEDMALRLGGHLSFNTNTPAPDAKTRAIEFSIAPGIEKHFAGTNRLSPYLGAELLLGLRSAHYELDGPGSTGVEIKGGFTPTGTADRGYFLVGLGAVGGFDFYVARHLYVGYELGMELTNRSYSEVEAITTNEAGTIETRKNEGTSALSFGPNVRNGIRLGFVF